VRYHALAADYDGTLALHGAIDDATLAALQRLRESGRRLIMVTGRELDELLGLLAAPELFDRIVAENGAVVYTPETKDVRLLATAPPASFVEELRRRGVDRVSAGRVIVATWEPHQDTVLATIRDMGLELQVIFNKGAVMVLPSGINKATGLVAALKDLGLSKHNVVGVGDAENDHALLELCEVGVAVANALPVLKARADLVTSTDHGAGVAELIARLIDDDLASVAPSRHRILLGKSERGEDVLLDPYASNIMVCGTSGSGKSTLTTGLLERLAAAEYQFAIVDPEGDYTSLELAVALGGTQRAPLVTEIVDLLKDPASNVVIDLLGVGVEERPKYFAQLLPALTELRTTMGRPHWLVVDEAHHLLPAPWQPADESSHRQSGTLYVSVHPESVAPAVLATINVMIAIGSSHSRRCAGSAMQPAYRCRARMHPTSFRTEARWCGASASPMRRSSRPSRRRSNALGTRASTSRATSAARAASTSAAARRS
jgi:HAD superfamily hydrolase (TIGR01484 family)